MDLLKSEVLLAIYGFSQSKLALGPLCPLIHSLYEVYAVNFMYLP